MKKFIKIIILVTISINIFASSAMEWKYKEWRVFKSDDGLIKYTTKGEVAQGNEFGFIKKTGNCSNDELWLTIYTTKKDIEKLKSKSATLEVVADKVKFTIEVNILSVFSLTSTSSVVLFSSFIANNNFIELLKKSSEVTFTVVAPTNIVKAFDIPYETFSLNGFTANYVKATEACKDPSVLNIAPNVQPKETVIYPVNNVIANHNVCDNIYSKRNVKYLTKEYSKLDLDYIVGNNYKFYQDGRDGRKRKPNIKVMNICDLNDEKLVTEIAGTEEQIFSFEYRDGLLFTMTGQRDTDVDKANFRIIDVKDMKNIHILSRLELTSLVPQFTVNGQQVYILFDKEILIYDINDLSVPTFITKIPVVFEKYSAADIAVDNNYIYVAGYKSLQIIDKKTYATVAITNFDFRPSELKVKDGIVYLEGFNKSTRLLYVIDTSKPRHPVHLYTKHFSRSLKLDIYENYLIVDWEYDIAPAIIFDISNPKMLKQIQ